MAEVLPRNVVIGMIVVVFIISAGIFAITNTYDELSLTTPDAVTSLNSQLSTVNSSVNELSGNLEGQFDSESEKGWVSKSCTALLGDDNFFCAGLDTLGALSETPGKMKITINLFRKTFPIEIPTWVFVTINSILVTIIVFVIISAYRRYKS